MSENGLEICCIDHSCSGEDPKKFLFEALVNAIKRLETLVMQETILLRENRAIGLQDFNQQKIQGLLELRRVIRGLEGSRFEDRIQDSLARLRGVLEPNLIALRNHLKAITGVTEIIAETVESYESDGTYSAVALLERQQK